MKRWSSIAGLVAILVLACLMPSGESLWIDETSTLLYASEPTLVAFKARILTETGSEAQMPLGMLAFWIWQKVAGSSEWGLRAVNILWTLLAAGALYRTGRRLRLPALPFWLIAQPFLWYYANEARPYVMQVAGAAWMLEGLLAGIANRGRGWSWAAALAAGALITAGASMVGVFSLIAVVITGLAVFIALRARPSPRAWLALGTGALLLAPLGFYYLQTLLRGAGGAKIWNVGLVNTGFAAYELGGFLGLGPGRLEIREAARTGAGPLGALLKPFAWQLGGLALLYALLIPPLLRGRDPERRLAAGAAAGVAALTAGLLMGAAGAAGFPFWGRHLAPLLPAWTLLIAWAADQFIRENALRPLARTVPFLLAALLAFSSAALRLDDRHGKEDYRRAARYAIDAAARGERIGWASDTRTASCYGLQTRDGTDLFAIRARDPATFESDTAGPAPDFVILSKPDIFDPHGRLLQWLLQNGFTETKNCFTGFSLWSRPPHD
ncbi:MAG: hypothetical protein R6X19_02505 [Kiritimatiellia bacterium]